MTILLDLIGSWFVRASMIAVMLGLTVTLNDALYQSSQQAGNNGNVAVIDSIIYADVNDAGYNVSPVSSTFQIAESTDLKFYADINGGGIPETVRYTITKQNDGTYNLYRNVNNVNNGVDFLLGNLTSASFAYYDAKSNLLPLPILDLTEIRQVGVTLVGSVVADTSRYKIYPANLL